MVTWPLRRGGIPRPRDARQTALRLRKDTGMANPCGRY